MLTRETTHFLLKRQKKEILERAGRIAIVGIRTEPYFKSYTSTEKLLAFGLEIAPVISERESFLGVPCYPSLEAVPGPVDIIQVYRRPDMDFMALAQEAVKKGALAFWMEDEAVPQEARKTLSNGKLYVVEYESLEREYSKHFMLGSSGRAGMTPGFTGKVSDRMTRHPVTIRPNDTIDDALAKMKRGHFRHLPVVREDGRLIGMLSDRDLRLIHPSLAFVPHTNATEQLKAAKVEQAAIFNPVVVLPDASLEEAAELMLRWEVGALPVVAGDAYLSGIITYSDLLREFVARGKETCEKAKSVTVPMDW